MFEAEKSRVSYLIKCSVLKYTYERLVVSDNHKIVTSLGEELGMFECPSNGKGFTLNRCIP